MNESQAVSTELDARCRWSLAIITELVNVGRARGWLPGEPCGAIDSNDVLRTGASPVESPMQLLAERLELTKVEVDLLWLFACIELDPHVSTAALLLLPPGMNELSAQLVERVIARGASLEDDVFERLDRLALIHSDNRLPLNRRPLRVSERVLDLARGLLRLDPKLKSIAILESAVEIRRKSVGIDQPLPAELCGAVGNGASALFIASGVEGAGRRTILRHAISACGRARDSSKLSPELRAQLFKAQDKIKLTDLDIASKRDLVSNAHFSLLQAANSVETAANNVTLVEADTKIENLQLDKDQVRRDVEDFKAKVKANVESVRFVTSIINCWSDPTKLFGNVVGAVNQVRRQRCAEQGRVPSRNATLRPGGTDAVFSRRGWENETRVVRLSPLKSARLLVCCTTARNSRNERPIRAP